MKLDEIFNKCLSLSLKKRRDYTTNPNIDNHENFKRSAEVASWFKDDEDKSYAVLIGTKLARLGSLLSSGREAQNESVEDSFVDLINYCALWAERRLEKDNEKSVERVGPSLCFFCNHPIDIVEAVTKSSSGNIAHKRCFNNALGSQKRSDFYR